MKIRATFVTIIILLIKTISLAQIFQDGPDGGADGEVPSKWDVFRGSAQLGTLAGNKAIMLENNSVISPNLGRTEYLSDSFKLEFEAYFAAVPRLSGLIYYQVRFWGGSANSSTYDNEYGSGAYLPIQLYRHRAQTVSRDQVEGSKTYSGRKSELEDKAEVWRSVSISYNKPSLQVSIDGIRILDIPIYKYDPNMISIECRGNEASDPSRIYAIRNVMVTGGTAGTRFTESSSGSENSADSNTDIGQSLIASYERNVPKDESASTHASTFSESEGVSQSNNSTNDETSGPSENLSAHSGLEALDEGNGTGWRLIGRDPQFYGNIGKNAVDLSETDLPLINPNIVHDGLTNVGATGYSSLAFGSYAKATGTYSISLGALSAAKDAHSIAIGSNALSTNEGGIAIGTEANALGEHASALGNKVEAMGDYSLALGTNVRALGNYDLAIGSMSEASGFHSFAIGTEVLSTNWFSTAMGRKTNAEGKNSFAIGFNSTAKGDYSNAIGYNLKSQAIYSTVIGMFNVGYGISDASVETNPLFEIGNGNGYKASNALTVLKNGNVGINEHHPSTKLHITGGKDASLENNTGYVVYGDESGTNLVFDNNEILARNNGNASTLHFQNSGGDVHVGGALAHTSDKRLKRDIADLPYGLSDVLELEPKSYFWKERDEGKRSIGLVAQDVQPIIAEIVRVGEDEQQTLSLNYTGLIPVLINAIKEQQAIIENQSAKIEALADDSENRDKILNLLNSRLEKLEGNFYSNKL